MEAIQSAAKNCYESDVQVEIAPGVFEQRTIKNYCVKLDIGFNLAKGEAFFYRIKSGINAESLAKDTSSPFARWRTMSSKIYCAYIFASFREMPADAASSPAISSIFIFAISQQLLIVIYAIPALYGILIQNTTCL